MGRVKVRREVVSVESGVVVRAWSIILRDRVAAIFDSFAVTGLCTWLLLRAAASAERCFISRTTLRVSERLMGLLLAALAVEFLVSDLADLLPRLRAP